LATKTRGEDITLQSGDAVAIPAGTSSSFRNDGQEVATALVVMIFSGDPFGPFARTSLDGVDVELLTGGMVETVPSSAVVLLSRESFAPGDSFTEVGGTVSGARNDGDTPAEILIVLVWPPEALAPQDAPEVATPTS
jgi:hypothetical protein